MTLPKIILDTDPGGDDAVAFLWLQSLAKQGLAEIVAITVAEGNVSAAQTFRNASQLLSLGGCPSVEIGRGVTLLADTKNAAHIHGSDGMGNLSLMLPLPTHDLETARYSDEIIIEQLNRFPGEITLVAIAPLTNLAVAEHKSPGILKKAKEIVVMGGAFGRSGNVTAHAEFNIFFNPTAAQMVFNSRSDSVVLPLDVTQHLIFTPEMAEAIAQRNPTSPLAHFLIALCQFMTRTALSYRETQGVSGFLVHDAIALAYLFYPEVLQFRRSRLQVETQGQWTTGQTLIDDRYQAKVVANAWIATQVDHAGFFTSFIADLITLIEIF